MQTTFFDNFSYRPVCNLLLSLLFYSSSSFSVGLIDYKSKFTDIYKNVYFYFLPIHMDSITFLLLLFSLLYISNCPSVFLPIFSRQFLNALFGREQVCLYLNWIKIIVTKNVIRLSYPYEDIGAVIPLAYHRLVARSDSNRQKPNRFLNSLKLVKCFKR